MKKSYIKPEIEITKLETKENITDFTSNNINTANFTYKQLGTNVLNY
ncbi:MAG: hypothetical protein LUG66_02855 [Clostridiales bacterium]|nr:hypothetical protein [Clostridiales bacterium]